MTTIRYRKTLTTPLPPPAWPAGVRPVLFARVDPRRLHDLLVSAFPGSIAPFDDWYGNLTHDKEFDRTLCIPALADDGTVAGFAQCWTSNFVKDLAVAPAYRGRGIGAALMQHVFASFSARGANHVDLKTSTEDDPAARRLYKRLGMVEVPL